MTTGSILKIVHSLLFSTIGDHYGLINIKGNYRLAKTKAVQFGLNNDWLIAQGLVSVKEQWVNPIIQMAYEPRMRTRLHGGVERAGEKPALTRLYFHF